MRGNWVQGRRRLLGVVLFALGLSPNWGLADPVAGVFTEFSPDTLRALSRNPSAATSQGKVTASPSLTVPLPNRPPIRFRGTEIKTSSLLVPVLDENVFESRVEVFTVVLASTGAQEHATFLTDGVQLRGIVESPGALFEVRPVTNGESASIHEVVPLSASSANTRCRVRSSSEPSAVGGDALPPRSGSPLSQKSASAPQTTRHVEILAFAPNGFIAGRLPSQAAFEIASSLTAASAFYAPLSLKLELKSIIAYREFSNDPFGYSYNIRSADEMLNTLSAVHTKSEYPVHDAAVVFAHGGGWMSDSDEVVGLASLSSMCTSAATAFVTSFPENLQATQYDIVTLAHEIGHLLGMDHDDTLYPEGASVMYSRGTQAPFFGFSTRSALELESYAGLTKRGGSCLTPLGVAADSQPPVVQFLSARTARNRSQRAMRDVKIQGSATDDAEIARVMYRVGKRGSWRQANGTTRWSLRIRVKGNDRPTLYVKAIDGAGNESAIRKKRI